MTGFDPTVLRTLQHKLEKMNDLDRASLAKGLLSLQQRGYPLRERNRCLYLLACLVHETYTTDACEPTGLPKKWPETSTGC